MNLDAKQNFIGSFSDSFSKSSAVFLVHYQGCTCQDITGIRKELKRMDSRLLVVKNTLARRAIRERGAESLADYLKGPTAVVLTGSDPVAPAKVISEFAKQKESFRVKAGWLDGQPLSSKDVESLANMPSKLELQAKLLSLINAPAVQLMGVISEPARGLVRLLGSWQEQLAKGNQGD
ncbi:MAG: 50S ribosomal protein L10 [Deltaproteobacteria bacterium]|nr:50S ribosomal protein L10 [Deltaproteobacteria bacterium]